MTNNEVTVPMHREAMHHLMTELWEIRSEDDRIHTVDLCAKLVSAGGDQTTSPLFAMTRRLHDVIATYKRAHLTP
jgi:hypothetical protein